MGQRGRELPVQGQAGQEWQRRTPGRAETREARGRLCLGLRERHWLQTAGQGGEQRVGGAEHPAMPCEGSRGWLHTRLLINTPDTHYKKKNQAEPQLNTKLQPSRWRGERRGPPTLLADPRCKLRVMPSLARGFSRLLHGQAPATSSPQLAAFALGHLPAC